MLRWIDELNGVEDADGKARELKEKIRQVRREPSSPQNKKEVRQLYKDLDALQFKPDYMCLIIDKTKDYYRACKGFKINGISYKRLLGTAGGIKNSTIVFVSERLADELRRRVENDRDQSKPQVAAKLEAYKALTCSASNPVSWPHGILVVKDVITTFKSDITYLTDEFDGDPLMEARKDEEIELKASDGCGMMLPSLAERWSRELGLDYVMSGCNSRAAFEKGMTFVFDFVDFAEKVTGTYIVKDAWGNEVDVRNVELVLTTSMLKLWDSYESCAAYEEACHRNHYEFGIPKVCPKELENERASNYQFLQSHFMTEADIDELIAPTMNEIRDVLSGDWRKAVLFLKGSGLNEKNVDNLDDDFIKALMIESRLQQDPFVQNTIYQLIRNRINQAKIGVLNMHANYSIVSGDLYLLCQSMFGMPLTGLLKAGEIYNQYWIEHGADKLLCYRAPMSCHPNIRAVHPAGGDAVRYWFRYIKTGTVFNGWDTASAALNGLDYDGDLVMLTDNPVLLRTHVPMPAIVCAQKTAQKSIPTEDDFVRSNVASFGNEIGQITNWVTSMYEVRAEFEPGSEEYKVLTYRIMCGQTYQQNSIDKAKGIVSKPMPREWHDRHAVNKIEDPEKRELYRRIVADRKPYFMRYIYPDLMKQYNTYIKNTNRNALREFGMTVPELKALPYSSLTERQLEFLRYYEYHMPVGTRDCVMNRICRKFEEAFDGYVARQKAANAFDYTILCSDVPYTARQYQTVCRLYSDYLSRVQGYAVFAESERVDNDDMQMAFQTIDDEFSRECAVACPNSAALCNILLDVCYNKSTAKRFVWKMAGTQIIQNLLDSHDGILSYPTLDENGEFEFCGNRYTVKTKRIEVAE